jgi:hypothetical protein
VAFCSSEIPSVAIIFQKFINPPKPRNVIAQIFSVTKLRHCPPGTQFLGYSLAFLLPRIGLGECEFYQHRKAVALGLGEGCSALPTLQPPIEAAFSAPHPCGPVPARNADPDRLKSKSNNKSC